MHLKLNFVIEVTDNEKKKPTNMVNQLLLLQCYILCPIDHTNSINGLCEVQIRQNKKQATCITNTNHCKIFLWLSDYVNGKTWTICGYITIYISSIYKRNKTISKHS